MKKLALILATLAMSGCVIKQPATEREYTGYAGLSAKLRACNASGEIPTSTAAAGMTLIQNQMNARFTYDANYLQNRINYYSQPEQLEEISRKVSCSDMALKITQVQQEIATSNQQAAAQNQAIQNFNNSVPKTTFCNRYGTMVTCNTY